MAKSTKSEPNMAEIYKATYHGLLDQIPSENKKRILDEVGKTTEPPKDIAAFITAVCISAEIQFDALLEAFNKTLKNANTKLDNASTSA